MGVDKVVEGGNGHLQMEREGGRSDGEGREGGKHVHVCTFLTYHGSTYTKTSQYETALKMKYNHIYSGASV